MARAGPRGSKAAPGQGQGPVAHFAGGFVGIFSFPPREETSSTVEGKSRFSGTRKCWAVAYAAAPADPLRCPDTPPRGGRRVEKQELELDLAEVQVQN